MGEIVEAFAGMVLSEFKRAIAPQFVIVRARPDHTGTEHGGRPGDINSGRRGQCLQALAHGRPMESRRIAEVTGIGPSAVGRSLRELEWAGMVRRVRRGWWQLREEVAGG